MGFLELRRQCGVSHEIRWGVQGSSCAAPEKPDSMRVARQIASLLWSHGRD